MHKSSPIFEDFIVILQKLTSRDPVPMRTLMSSRLIETLNSVIGPAGKGDARNEFIVQNVKSILKNISSA